MGDPTPAIQAVIFDLDDTLYPERDYVRSGYRAVANHLAGARRPGDLEDWVWARFLRGQHAGAFDALNETFSLGLDKSGIARLVDVYRRHSPAIRPCGGVPDLLGLLHGRYLLGLLSDAYLPGGQLKLQALRVERFFDAVVFTEALGPGRRFWKPSPSGYEQVASLLGVPPAACAFVGDNPAKDFLGANALGLRTIQYLQPGQLAAGLPAPPGGQPHYAARNPGEIVEALLD